MAREGRGVDGSVASRGPSRSAQLVAACRALASELPDDERLIEDVYARYFADEAAMEAARANEPLQRVIRLRTRYIDDALIAFAGRHPSPQVLLLGAGVDARALRLDVGGSFFEVDFPATLALKEKVLSTLGIQSTSRTAVPIELGQSPIRPPLEASGFDASQPTFVIWEGVINYIDDAGAVAAVEELGSLLAPGSQIVADYVEGGRVDARYRSNVKKLVGSLQRGDERLGAGLVDFLGTFARAGFRVLDDGLIEDLVDRYGLADGPRYIPGRIALVERVESTTA